jgi:soluble lytic murein transglycosylase
MYGIIRQESAFMKDVRSSAGALGLMQLMPGTGREESRRLKLNVRSRSEILEVKNNLRLGASHLHTVLNRHGDNQMLATAAYNAGSHRVKRWRPEKKMAADIWTESIPYNETRNYVKNVMAFTTIYMYRLGKNIMRLQSRMQAVEGKNSEK